MSTTMSSHSTLNDSTNLEDIQEGEKLQFEQGGIKLADEQGDERSTSDQNEMNGDATNGDNDDEEGEAKPKKGPNGSNAEETTTENGENKPLPTTGDSPLTKILERLETLSEKEQELVRLNLERVGRYPRDLPLSHPWTMHFSDTSGASKASHGNTADAYDDAVKPMWTSRTVFELCGTLKAYKKAVASKISPSNKRGSKAFSGAPGTTPADDSLGLTRTGQNLHFFRSGVSPTWEDPWNSKGGRVIVQPNPAMFEPVFEKLVLLLAGSAIEVGATDILKSSGKKDAKEGLIIGAVASRRARGDRIEVWLGGTEKMTPPPSDWIEAIKERLSIELELPEIKTGAKYRSHFGK